MFVDLYNEGLIYKDKRLVNWDPEFQSAISDLEVEMIEVKGNLWHFKYPLKDGTYRFPTRSMDGKPTMGDATTSSSPPRGPRRCWATRRLPCIPRTSATRR